MISYVFQVANMVSGTQVPNLCWSFVMSDKWKTHLILMRQKS